MRYFNPSLQRPRKRQAPEAHLVRNIITYLNLKGFRAAKIKTHGVWDEVSKGYRADPNAWRGVPDILCFTPALIFIECKSATGVQSSYQKLFQDYCNKAGVIYILARDLSDIQKVFA